MIDNLYEWMQNYNRQGIVFSFNGSFSEIIIREIVNMLKKFLAEENASHSTIFNLFSVVVELVQNINLYSASRTVKIHSQKGETESGLGMIFAGMDGDDFFILSGNPIENHQIEKIRTKLEKIRTMNKDELRKYYKSELKKESPADSKGGGVGLIEIARKASKPIDFNFKRIDDHLSFLSLKICVLRN